MNTAIFILMMVVTLNTPPTDLTKTGGIPPPTGYVTDITYASGVCAFPDPTYRYAAWYRDRDGSLKWEANLQGAWEITIYDWPVCVQPLLIIQKVSGLTNPKQQNMIWGHAVNCDQTGFFNYYCETCLDINHCGYPPLYNTFTFKCCQFGPPGGGGGIEGSGGEGE